jgi:hypothetical protein
MSSPENPSIDVEDDGVGYRRPPRTSRFTKGKSGNPAGRPRGRHRQAPHEAVLGQMVTIREGGKSAESQRPRHFCSGWRDGAAARASLAVIEEARSKRSVGAIGEVLLVAGGSITLAPMTIRSTASRNFTSGCRNLVRVK